MNEAFFLARHVEEVVLTAEQRREPRTWPLEELLKMGRFILLGDPGMGKSEALKWLAGQSKSLKPIHASDLSSGLLVEQRRDGWLFVDALDESQADPGQTSALSHALDLVDKEGQRWGLSCRLADIHRADLERFHRRAEDGGQSAPLVLRLLPLRPEQVRQFLVEKSIPDPDAWLEHVNRLGWHDVASNPQSLIFLLKATEGGQWPETRSQVFEMACDRLVKEHNKAHRSRAKFDASSLLHAAGWVCAMLLLCAKQRVADVSEDAEDAADALDIQALATSLPASVHLEHVHQALKTRLFQDRAPVHRTVAEYLAAKSIVGWVSDARSGGMLAQRLEPLFMAGRAHLRTDLRGLAGWLGSLHRSFQPLVRRDPEAALFYGDLARLCDWDKQFLIAALADTPTASIPWEAAMQNKAALAPLVSEALQHYVQDGFKRFAQKPQAVVSAAEVRAALVLLQGLQAAQPDPLWEPCLLNLIRRLDWNSTLREIAFEALPLHAPTLKTGLLPIWKELASHSIKDSDHRLFPALVEALYPEAITLEEVFTHPARWTERQDSERLSFDGWSQFWDRDFPDKIAQAGQLGLACRLILDEVPTAEGEGPSQFRDALKSTLPRLIARFILVHGEQAPAQQLAQCWQRLMPYGSLERDELPADAKLMAELTAWQVAHPTAMRAAMFERLLLNEDHPHLANCFLRREDQPDGWQYLRWAEALIQRRRPSLAEYCVREAYALAQWAEPVNRVLMESAFSICTQHATLNAALDKLTVQTLDPNDPTVRHQQYLRRNLEKSQDFRDKEAAYLRERLDNLGRVASGEDLHFLELCAWTLIGGSYVHNHEHKLVKTWLEQHPALEQAAQQGARALLNQLESDTWQTVFQKRSQGMLLLMEIPLMWAAQTLHQADASAMAHLAQHQALGLWSCRLLGGAHSDAWFTDLLIHHAETIAPHWQQFLKHPPKGCENQARDSLTLLSRLESQDQQRSILEPLLQKHFSRMPASKVEMWVAFIRAALPVCSQSSLTQHLERLLARHASDPSIHSLVLAASLSHAPTHFAPQLQSMPTTAACTRTLMKAWARFDKQLDLRQWDAQAQLKLFSLGAEISRPGGGHRSWGVSPEDTAENLCRRILECWSQDPSEEAANCLATVAQAHASTPWAGTIAQLRITQFRVHGEHALRLPSPTAVTRLLANRGPNNPLDFRTLAFEALTKIQQDIRDDPFNLRSLFWTGTQPKLENECRDVIGPRLLQLLPAGIDCAPEVQHSEQNRCDLQLSTHVDGNPIMLPIEIKMDWNPSLWTAPLEQLHKRYMGDRRCHSMGQPQGIYLVLWVGAQRGNKAALKRHPNLALPSTPADLLNQLEAEIQQHQATEGIKVFVLDISASR